MCVSLGQTDKKVGWEEKGSRWWWWWLCLLSFYLCLLLSSWKELDSHFLSPSCWLREKCEDSWKRFLPFSTRAFLPFFLSQLERRMLRMAASRVTDCSSSRNVFCNLQSVSQCSWLTKLERQLPFSLSQWRKHHTTQPVFSPFTNPTNNRKGKDFVSLFFLLEYFNFVLCF